MVLTVLKSGLLRSTKGKQFSLRSIGFHCYLTVLLVEPGLECCSTFISFLLLMRYSNSYVELDELADFSVHLGMLFIVTQVSETEVAQSCNKSV